MVEEEISLLPFVLIYFLIILFDMNTFGSDGLVVCDRPNPEPEPNGTKLNVGQKMASSAEHVQPYQPPTRVGLLNYSECQCRDWGKRHCLYR